MSAAQSSLSPRRGATHGCRHEERRIRGAFGSEGADDRPRRDGLLGRSQGFIPASTAPTWSLATPSRPNIGRQCPHWPLAPPFWHPVFRITMTFQRHGAKRIRTAVLLGAMEVHAPLRIRPEPLGGRLVAGLYGLGGPLNQSPAGFSFEPFGRSSDATRRRSRIPSRPSHHASAGFEPAYHSDRAMGLCFIAASPC
jgi:hypothetical protein